MHYKYFKFNNPNQEKIRSQSSLNKKSFIERILTRILPKSNPDIEKHFNDVNVWMLEYDLKGQFFNREIGIDKSNKVLFKAPIRNNLGFWVDTDLKLEDVEKYNPVEIDKSFFESYWVVRSLPLSSLVRSVHATED